MKTYDYVFNNIGNILLLKLGTGFTSAYFILLEQYIYIIYVHLHIQSISYNIFLKVNMVVVGKVKYKRSHNRVWRQKRRMRI